MATPQEQARPLGLTLVTRMPAELSRLQTLAERRRRSAHSIGQTKTSEGSGEQQLSLPGLAADEIVRPRIAGDADPVLDLPAKDESWEGWVGRPVLVLLIRTPRVGTSEETQLVGLAQGHPLRRGRYEDNRRLQVFGPDLLERPVAWDEVAQQLLVVDRDALGSNLDGLPQLIRGARAHRLLGAVLASARRNTNIHERVRLAMAREHGRQGMTGGRVGRRRDAIRVAGMPNAEETQLDAGQIPEKVRKHMERFFIKHDARTAAPRWARSDAPATWWRYEKDGRRLFVLDSDADEGEHELGGDLIYLREQPAALLVVQYKRLTSASNRSAVATCEVDERFVRQLERMAALENDHGTIKVKRPEEYRLSTSGGYVKLINAWEQEIEGELFPGIYLPADYLQLLIGASKDGIVTIDKDRDRTIDPQTFVRLVGDGWLGTRAATTEQLLSRLDATQLLVESQPHTVAAELGVSR